MDGCTDVFVQSINNEKIENLIWNFDENRNNFEVNFSSK
jgi:hypothetical protein